MRFPISKRSGRRGMGRVTLGTVTLGTIWRALLLALVLLTGSSIASAYYHWVYYVSRTGAFVPIA